jgi:hypothetical protein
MRFRLNSFLHFNERLQWGYIHGRTRDQRRKETYLDCLFVLPQAAQLA